MKYWTRSVRVSAIVSITLVFASLALACGNSGPSAEVKPHLEAASSLMDKKDYDGAVNEYNQAIVMDPKSDVAYESRGIAYTELKQYDLAVADFAKAIELAPDRGGPYYGRGVAYRLQGDLGNAIADLSRAVGNRNTTKWRGALYERGLAYKEQGNTAEARADFERIIQLEQQFPGEADKSWAEKAQVELSAIAGT